MNLLSRSKVYREFTSDTPTCQLCEAVAKEVAIRWPNVAKIATIVL